MNLKTIYLIKKCSDTKLKEFKAKKINLELKKSTEYHCRGLIIKYLF